MSYRAAGVPGLLFVTALSASWLVPVASTVAQVDSAFQGRAQLLATELLELSPTGAVSSTPAADADTIILQYEELADGYIFFSILLPRSLFAEPSTLAPLRVDNPSDLEAVASVVRARPSAFGFEDAAEFDALHEMGIFRVRNSDQSESPSGRLTKHVVLRQELNGIPLTHGECHFSFVDGVFVSFSGHFPSLDTVRAAATVPAIDADEAERLAAAHLANDGVIISTRGSEHLVIDSLSGRLRWSLTVGTEQAPDEEDASGLEVVIDALDGTFVSQRTLGVHLDRDYLHLQPTATNYRAATTQATSIESYEWGTDVFPWTGPRTNRSPLATYNSYYTSAGVVKFDVHPQSGGHFTHPTTWPAFLSQHAHRWTLRALETADINFTWFSPPSSHKWHGVTLFIQMNSVVNAEFKQGGCGSTWTLWSSPHGSWPCIVHRSGNWTAAAGGHAIDVLFHEVGHAIDWKYLAGNNRVGTYSGSPCDFNTSDEARSLSEGIGILYSMMMTLQEFHTLDFTDYLFANDLKTQVIWGQVGAGYTVHDGPGTRACHGYVPNGSGGTLDCTSFYSYNRPLIQAYWEVANARNCTSSPCTEFNDGVGIDQARWALFDAMKKTPQNGTHRNFVSRFLDYMYYNHYAGWANRWWVFNGYNLVGTLFTSPAQCN